MTAVRKDHGYWPYVIFAVIGAVVMDGALVFLAAHDMLVGGAFRHYDGSYYVTLALFGAVAGMFILPILGWAFHAEDDELDADEEESEIS